jgi:hypothetical protein
VLTKRIVTVCPSEKKKEFDEENAFKQQFEAKAEVLNPTDASQRQQQENREKVGEEGLLAGK